MRRLLLGGFPLGGIQGMLKILGVSVATLLALTFSVVPAGATGAQTFTTHIDQIHDVIPATCAGPFTGVSLVNATGNGVQHGTINSTGDWFTATFEGQGTVQQVTFTQAGPVAGAIFQGHVQEWIGSEDNLQNAVPFHATFNFQGTNVANPAQALAMHIETQWTINANGTTTVQRFTVSC